MKTTPYFRIALVALGLLVLTTFAILNKAVAADRQFDHAPIYTPAGEGVLRYVGDLRYPATPGYDIHFCIAEKAESRTVRCALRSMEDGLLVFVELTLSSART